MDEVLFSVLFFVYFCGWWGWGVVGGVLWKILCGWVVVELSDYEWDLFVGFDFLNYGCGICFVKWRCVVLISWYLSWVGW